MTAKRHRRLACVFVPLFPLAARIRSEPQLLGAAAAVFDGDDSTARLVAATREARRAGLRPDMKRSQARTLLPDLQIRAHDPVCEHTAQAALLEVAFRYSPRVEDAHPGVLYLDLTGLERHYRNDKPGGSYKSLEPRAVETEIARDLIADADLRADVPAWIGVASSKLAARVAAERMPTPTIVAPSEEAAFLAPLPLDRLRPEATILETLSRWGISSIGDLAALPANAVASRLGDAGLELHKLARGEDRRPLIPRPPPELFCEGLELDWPLVALEPFLFVAKATLERLCRRLDTRGLASIQLDLSLHLEPGGFCERSIRLPAPSREVKTLLTLVRLELERAPPNAPITGFTFQAHPDRPQATQLTVFGRPTPAPETLATSLARLFALLGPGAMGSPVPLDSFLPDRFELAAFRPPDPPELAPPPDPTRNLLAVRSLRPPVAVSVRTRNGFPVSLDTAGVPPADRGRSHPMCGSVRVASGPWHLEERWWEASSSLIREYWDVELEGGTLYRIFLDAKAERWFVDGVYD